jgi:hypothetical protein
LQQQQAGFHFAQDIELIHGAAGTVEYCDIPLTTTALAKWRGSLNYSAPWQEERKSNPL